MTADELVAAAAGQPAKQKAGQPALDAPAPLCDALPAK
jgi:hypothetical protein